MVDVPLRERLPLYPKYVEKEWYSRELKYLISSLSDAEGFRKTY
jgi:FO synthase subunit 1